MTKLLLGVSLHPAQVVDVRVGDDSGERGDGGTTSAVAERISLSPAIMTAHPPGAKRGAQARGPQWGTMG